MKLSAGSFSTKTLMVVQYVTICGGAAAFVALAGDARAALASFESLDAAGLVVLCALSLVVSFGAAEAQIVCIRLCANQIFNPTSICAYSNISTHALRLCFENSTRAIDLSKNQPNRRRFDRDREF